jgi:hypothetical protein
LSYWQFIDFSLHKSGETYMGNILPPGGRKWQLIFKLEGLGGVGVEVMRGFSLFASS